MTVGAFRPGESEPVVVGETDAAGRFRLLNLRAGVYEMGVHFSTVEGGEIAFESWIAAVGVETGAEGVELDIDALREEGRKW